MWFPTFSGYCKVVSTKWSDSQQKSTDYWLLMTTLWMCNYRNFKALCTKSQWSVKHTTYHIIHWISCKNMKQGLLSKYYKRNGFSLIQVQMAVMNNLYRTFTLYTGHLTVSRKTVTKNVNHNSYKREWCIWNKIIIYERWKWNENCEDHCS